MIKWPTDIVNILTRTSLMAETSIKKQNNSLTYRDSKIAQNKKGIESWKGYKASFRFFGMPLSQSDNNNSQLQQFY